MPADYETASTRNCTRYWTAPTSTTLQEEKKAMDTEKIIQRIEERLREWGHHHAPGCVVCTTARMLIDEAIRHDGEGFREAEGVTVRGPPS
jgi:hypothetical protein